MNFRHTGTVLLFMLLFFCAQPALPQGDSPRTMENRAYEYAAALAEKGSAELAIRELERFVAAWPRSKNITGAWYLIAESNFRLRHFDRTIAVTRRIRTEAPSAPLMDQVLFLEGQALFHLGRYGEAIASLEKMRAGYPGSTHAAGALYSIAQSHEHLGNFREAEESYLLGATKYPESALADWSWYNAGIIRERAGDSKGAIEAFGMVVANYPHRPLKNICQYRMGEEYFRSGDYTQAAEMISCALGGADDRRMIVNGRYLLGDTYYRLGKYALARENYRVVYDEFPGDQIAADAMDASGWALLAENRYHEAAETFEEVMRKYPERIPSASTWFRLGLTRKLGADSARAAEIFIMITATFPESEYATRSLYELGMMSYDAGLFDRAAEFFEQAASRYPLSAIKPDALVMYAQSVLPGGDYRSALIALTEVTDSYREASCRPLAFFLRSFCECRLEYLSDAELTAGTFLAVYPEHSLAPDVLLILAETRYRLGNYTGSRDACFRLLERYPQSRKPGEALYGIGWASLRMRDYSRAADAFTRLRERFPGSGLAPNSDVSLKELNSGRTTGVLQKYGDRQSLATITPERIEYPMEPRVLPDITTVIPEIPAPDIARAFGNIPGTSVFLDGFLGSRTLADFNGMISRDDDRSQGTLSFFSRARTENSPTNLAPLAQGVTGTRYLTAGTRNYAISGGFERESEFTRSKRFRGQDRRMGRVFCDARIDETTFAKWKIGAYLSADGGKYHDPRVYDRGAVNLRGSAEASGNMDGLPVTASTEINRFAFGAAHGSLFSLGGDAFLNPEDNLGIRLGAGITSSAMPGHGTKSRLYPEASLDWAINGVSSLKLEIAPRVISHSFGDLYALNGLLTPDVPLLYENRRFDFSGEYHLRLRPWMRLAAELFARESENAPVFSRTGSLFEIVRSARLRMSGVRLGAEAERGRWSGDGALTLRKTSWNKAGEVPYIPSVSFAANGRFIPRDTWVLYGSLRIEGKHYLQTGSDAAAKAFMTLDAGAERDIVKHRMSGYAEVRNIFNSSGAWWTGEYRVPEIGLHAGLKAEY